MDKTDIMSRLTFCGDCVYWHPFDDETLKEEYRGYVGYCNRPYVGMTERYKDDFCSQGIKKED